MKVAAKIQSLMLDLKNETEKEAQDKIDLEIIRVVDLLPKEVELIKAEKELSVLMYADNQGITIDFGVAHDIKDSIDKLKKELDEGLS